MQHSEKLLKDEIELEELQKEVETLQNSNTNSTHHDSPDMQLQNADNHTLPNNASLKFKWPKVNQIIQFKIKKKKKW